MDSSCFTDKANRPGEFELAAALGDKYTIWNEIKEFVLANYPAAIEEWNYPGAKYGWSFRIKDKKRVLVYFMPFSGFFRVSFVFGAKATEEALNSSITDDIKEIIKSAKVYAEGRGFRIEVKQKKLLKDIKKLIEIKLSN